MQRAATGQATAKAASPVAPKAGARANRTASSAFPFEAPCLRHCAPSLVSLAG
jgi:hypothetical protein